MTDSTTTNIPETHLPLFELLAEHQGNTAEMLAVMIDYFRQHRRPMELFESLKMQVRHRLGLPLLASETDELRQEDIDRQLEEGLLNACREAGTMLIQDGNIREGWMYLRPTGDNGLAKRLLANVAVNDDNYDDMVQVLLHEGVDVGRGYQAVVHHQGTCNSITIFEQSIATRSRNDRKAAARVLLEHLYGELESMVRSDIARREAPAAESETIFDMIENRRWILQEGGYHLDTTHLASTVRIASVLDEPHLLQKAWELTQYGRRLAHQFQYPGDEPFVDFYPAYATYYATLLGREVDAGLKFFERRAKSVDTNEHGTSAIETYVDLLDRTGHPSEAIDATIRLVPSDVPSQRIVPLLIELAGHVPEPQHKSAYEKVLAYCKTHGDVLGYTAACDALGHRAN